jgi:hypothetical protein
MTIDFKETVYKSTDHILDQGVHASTSLHRFVTLCIAGITQGMSASEFPRFRKEIDKIKKLPDPFPTEEEFEEAIERGKKLEEFAKVEVQNNFPFLLNLASVNLWGIIEATVDDLGSILITSWPECRDSETVRRIRGPLIEFASASESEQAEYLLSELKRSVNASLKLGIDRFESILNCLCLGGSVHELVKELFFELSQIRNIVVHNVGKADKKIVESCPWLGLQIGQDVKTDHPHFMTYMGAADWYFLELQCRCCVLTSHPIDPQILPLQEKILKRISTELRPQK